MFTGIIEQLGVIKKIEQFGTNTTFTINAALAAQLKIDQSLSHNGVCLTVEEIDGDEYKVTAIEETLKKTALSYWEEGTVLNLERCLRFDGRLDGHIVQGHVDIVGKCIDYKEKNGSWEYTIDFDKQFAPLIVEKGSISLNGISLTIFNITDHTFTVAIIPYTYNNTSMQNLKVGDFVNIEFDMLGKYINRMNNLASK
jgi:riboflavin synthase